MKYLCSAKRYLSCSRFLFFLGSQTHTACLSWDHCCLSLSLQFPLIVDVPKINRKTIVTNNKYILFWSSVELYRIVQNYSYFDITFIFDEVLKFSLKVSLALHSQHRICPLLLDKSLEEKKLCLHLCRLSFIFFPFSRALSSFSTLWIRMPGFKETYGMTSLK